MYEVRINSTFSGGTTVVVHSEDEANLLSKMIRSTPENMHLSVEIVQTKMPFFIVGVTPDREKILAVKAIRNFTRLGLVASKNLVESSGFVGTYSLDEVRELRKDLNAAGYTLLTEKELVQQRAHS